MRASLVLLTRISYQAENNHFMIMLLMIHYVSVSPNSSSIFWTLMCTIFIRLFYKDSFFCPTLLLIISSQTFQTFLAIITMPYFYVNALGTKNWNTS